MDMAKVQKCSVDDCAYNKDNKCHALAITIGDGDNPQCDTYCHASNKGGEASAVAGVGACKVAICRFNQMLECTAGRVNIGWKGQEADCLTFTRK